MKIYLAGLFQTGFSFDGEAERSENTQLAEDTRRAYPYDLESFFYIRKISDAARYFRGLKKSIFLDSGAFTMFTKGEKIDLASYAQYIKDNIDWVHVASNLDAIGQGQEEITYSNQKGLEKLGVSICPVHHARDDDKWLKRYLADGYEYIFLGGMVPETSTYLRGWLDHVWDKFLTKKDGTARVKVHGFGMTTFDLMRRYPWHSVDSTGWVMLSRYGNIFVDLPTGRDVKISISSDSKAVYTFDRHFDNMAEPTQKFVDEIIRGRGYDPELLRTHYGWRDHWNINYFRRFCERPDPTFRKQQIGVFD